MASPPPAEVPSSPASHAVIFTTSTPYPLPTQKFMIPTSWKRYQLSQLINKALALPTPVPFDFIIKGDILRSSLNEWCRGNGVSEEETLEIEYIESVLPPNKMSDYPHEEWVSGVSCHLEGHFLTSSYDGHFRAFDYSQDLKLDNKLHDAPITSFCVVPSSSAEENKKLIASASHDLTAQLTQISFASKAKAKALASLHLHTGPLSCVRSNASGTHLLTSSWDTLIGLWDTSIPSTDEVPLSVPSGMDGRKKRRKLDSSANEDDEQNDTVNGGEQERPKRKAPLMVLKAHTARVSGVSFDQNGKKAYSCGFDSTVRMWDVENGYCEQTINASEKPFLSLLCLPSSPSVVLASATDRTVTQYDFRLSSSSAVLSSVSTLTHPATTPSCLALSPNENSHQIISGAYDGVVRVWDLRGVGAPVASFKAWDGEKKVLGVDWGKAGVVGVAGEGGLGVWRIGEQRSGSVL